VWDFESLSILHRLTLHKVRVQDLAFSDDESLLASLGGEDDKQLVVWSLENGKPICGNVASAEPPNALTFFHGDRSRLITCGKFHARVWEIDFRNRKVTPENVTLGKYKRDIYCMTLRQDNQVLFCGTHSGDVLSINLSVPPYRVQMLGPKIRFSEGVMCIYVLPNDDLLVGGGDGTYAVLDSVKLTIRKKMNVMGGVTSLALHPGGKKFFIGTRLGNIYVSDTTTMEAKLHQTCHHRRVNSVAFPHGYSGLFATSSFGNIRLWNTNTAEELLRIEVPNLECNCLSFTHDGSLLLSGWEDGKIRAFGPESGKIVYVINDAHILERKRLTGPLQGVTALAATSDARHVVSGGSDGQVRIWRVMAESQSMVASMKEHRGTVNRIRLSEDDTECVSGCDDGSCIVWDLTRFVRSNILYSQTFFKDVCYLNDESQLVTVGTDRKVTYWDAVECSAIRELEASMEGEVWGLDITKSGDRMITVGQDKLVRMWDYNEGAVTHVGVGHSGGITGVEISPDESYAVTVGDEGGIFLWDL
jgi:cilia- and flagella-associated protein 52